MYGNDSNMSHMNQFLGSPYQQGYPRYQPSYQYNGDNPTFPYLREQRVIGQATWTEGGLVTKCEIPWSLNHYMTVAVGSNAPYKCGQKLKVRNLSMPGNREITVTVVDEVVGYPPNKINLHRKAFEALGANPGIGVINVEIIPSTGEKDGVWRDFLVGVIQTAYPEYRVVHYQFVGKTQVTESQTKETYDFTLHSQQGAIKIRATVIYNPSTNHIFSFEIKEL